MHAGADDTQNTIVVSLPKQQYPLLCLIYVLLVIPFAFVHVYLLNTVFGALSIIANSLHFKLSALQTP